MSDLAKTSDSKTKSSWKNYFSWSQIRASLLVVSRTPRVFGLVWSARPALAAYLVVAQVLLGLIPLANVWALKILVDVVPTLFQTKSFSLVEQLHNLPLPICTALGLMAFARFAHETLQPMRMYCNQQLNDYLARDINLLITDKVNSIIDISILENPKFYDQLQRVQNDLNDKPVKMVVIAGQLGEQLIAVLSLAIVLSALSPWLVLLITTLPAPRIVWVLKEMYQNWQVEDGDAPEIRRMRYYTNVQTNSLDGKEVRLFGLGGFLRSRFLCAFDQLQTKRTNVRKSNLFWNFSLGALSSSGSIVSYLYVVLQTLAGAINTGAMALYLGAIAQMASLLLATAYSLSELYRMSLFVGRLFDFLEIKPAITPLSNASSKPIPSPIRHCIEFCNVSFKYPDSDRFILQGISFKITPGQTLALVGENGAGKTTIVKLLCRFYDPTEGKILVDGLDLREIDPVEWRTQLAVVFQDYSKFQMSARDNIGIGQIEQLEDTAAVKIAAEHGGASLVVEKLKDGYDTMLGKMFEEKGIGTELSGGEWQKIALARAFMRSSKRAHGTASEEGKGKEGKEEETHRQAQLLILDEPTASLDVQSEHDVYCKFHELTEDKMALLITHRFSTVRIADKILVLEDGKVLEEGSHDELMSFASNYARLYHLQADRYQLTQDQDLSAQSALVRL